MVLLIDNYDSFTYNLYQYFLRLELEVVVVRNDAIEIKDIEEMSPEMIVLSPGPGTPVDSGICREVVRRFMGGIPILGICLGMQTIAAVLGACVCEASEPMHGKNSLIVHNGRGAFKRLKSPLRVTRYHSLIVDNGSIPSELEVTARTDCNEIMGLRHNKFLVEGVQFHPEAYMTEMGLELLENFCREAGLIKEVSC